MAHKAAIEALDRTLKDIRNSPTTMGGVTVMFSGDFRQTLPVVVRGTRADDINASLKRSTLWPTVERLSLTLNMRAVSIDQQRDEEFSEILIKLGDGTLDNINGIITIPPSLGVVVSSQDELITNVFPGVHDLLKMESAWLCDRTILSPKNDQAKQINMKVMALFHSEERTYTSVNTVLREDDAVNYPAVSRLSFSTRLA
ncbi:uncharacterized protein LOC128984535 [Macrosteles quadrilineatus]|uniref:uncharacterized protein LOC128984502 n=1 Tax=Macrosteles quadrilineatus TaxID=74068 RepID=UPI0023E18630|nr:uncharacterized protein LOC128984502 [Macrosteles quadrilineatus]XP_054259842.1 uncharacterized protein LOC128984535 [Macrosteles quadrilineatus]